MSAMASDLPFGTNEREFQIECTEDAQDIFKPKSVLEVGAPEHPDDRVVFNIWKDAQVDTVDPYVEDVTFKCKFEDFEMIGLRYDLINMSSVLDYFDDPIACVRKAQRCGRVILLQGRLNTYQSPYFKANYWVPSKKWVEERAALELGLKNVEWLKFQKSQFFSICGTT